METEETEYDSVLEKTCHVSCGKDQKKWFTLGSNKFQIPEDVKY